MGGWEWRSGRKEGRIGGKKNGVTDKEENR